MKLPLIAHHPRKNSNYGGYQAYIEAGIEGNPGTRYSVAKALGEHSREAKERAEIIARSVNAHDDMLVALHGCRALIVTNMSVLLKHDDPEIAKTAFLDFAKSIDAAIAKAGAMLEERKP